MNKTVADRRAERAERDAKRALRDAFEDRILSALPPELEAPTISNESERAFFDQAGAWLSFRSYSFDRKPGADTLHALELAGFKPMACTFTKWDQYRGHPEPGAAEHIPDEKGRYKLTSTEPIAPLWIVPNQHTGSEAQAFYRSPDGLVLKVCVSTTAPAYLTASRTEFPGGWSYKSGTAKIQFPENWHSLADVGGEIVAMLASPRAYVDTEQGLSGALYWNPVAHEQEDFPLSPAQLLAILER